MKGYISGALTCSDSASDCKTLLALSVVRLTGRFFLYFPCQAFVFVDQPFGLAHCAARSKG